MRLRGVVVVAAATCQVACGSSSPKCGPYPAWPEAHFVELHRAGDAAWPVGDYRVAWATLSPSGTSQNGDVSCPVTALGYTGCRSDVVGLYLIVSSDPSGAQITRLELKFVGIPASDRISVRRDGTIIAEASFTPEARAQEIRFDANGCRKLPPEIKDDLLLP